MKKDQTDQTRYNAMKVNIEKRIASGNTKFFEVLERDRAKEYAKYKRSYIDECFKRDDEGVYYLVGYCVPN